jgi:hypothetical protein
MPSSCERRTRGFTSKSPLTKSSSVERALVNAERDGSTATPIKREADREVEVVAVAGDEEDASALYIVGGDGPLGEVHLGELGLSPTRALPRKEEDAGRGVNMSITPWTPPEGLEEESVPESEGEDDADDILLIVGEDGLARNMRPEELALSPVNTEYVKGEAADQSFVPAVPNVYVYPAEPPHINIDAEDDAPANTAGHKHDTMYQRRRQLRRQQKQQQHRASLSPSPSRFRSRPYVQRRQAAVPPHQQEWALRIAAAALDSLGG